MLTLPWSKRHKAVTKNDQAGLAYNLSNSFAQPTSMAELEELARARGDGATVDDYRTHHLGYAPNGGSRDVREAVSAAYERCAPEDVLITSGGQVALQTACFALLDAAAHAIVFSPSYQSCQEAPAHAGAEVTKIRLKAADGWAVDVGAVEAACRPNTRMILLNQPWNPAGTLMPKADQLRLIEVARERGIHVLCDEVYRLLEHDPADRLPAMADAYELGLSVVALSKPFGAGGTSLGWLATRDAATRQRCVDAQYFGTACAPRAAELQACLVLRARDFLLERNLEIIRANVALAAAFVARNSDLFSWTPPRAGAVGFLRFDGPCDSAELGEALAREGISVKPAYCFSQEAEDDIAQYFRIGFGERKVPEALAALEAFVGKHRGTWTK
mmetsp:Transcript_5818/g.17190  ORF Transcript_5818/g.17190 Transcript_5818/m.17190 type:complete len:388 (-) Transcript_5818:8-1171(-)